MNKDIKALFKAFLLFLLPILRGAVVKAAADELTKLAYPERRRPFSPRPRAMYNTFDRMIDDEQRIPPQRDRRVRDAGYEGTIMVAFHMIGPSQALAEEWVQSRLPRPMRTDEFNMSNIRLQEARIERDSDKEAGDDERN